MYTGRPEIHPDNGTPQPAPDIASGHPTLQPATDSELQDAVDSARHNEEQRQLLFQDFYNHCRHELHVDIFTDDQRDEVELALVIQGYAWSRVNTRLDKIQTQMSANPEVKPPDVRLLDRGQITEAIKNHYARYGQDRRFGSREKRREEESFLASAKDRATAVTFARDRREEILGFVEGDDAKLIGIPRYVTYPEIRLVMELRQALVDARAFVAAKAAEVTFAAYGSVFPVNLRRRGVNVVNDAGIVRQLIKASEEDYPDYE